MESKFDKKRKFESISNMEEEKDEAVKITHEAKRRKIDDNPEKRMKRLILWLRNDLRLHDNYVIDYAVKHQAKNKEILPVFCFDDRFLTKRVNKWDIRKCGLIRTRFLLETVQNMRQNLKAIDSELLVSMERPEILIPKLIEDENYDTEVVYHDEICSEELAVEKNVKESLKSFKNAKIKSFWGSTLYHIDDLPYKTSELAHIYGKFRERSQNVQVRKLVDTPKKGDLPYLSKDKKSKIITEAEKFMPKLEDFGFTKEEIEKPKDKRACYDFVGGEDNGIKRVSEYIMETKSVGQYAQTRNGLIGANYSSKFSPWLAVGALSPRYIYFKTREFEQKYRANESTKVFIDELFWRDFNRFWCMKYGSQVFSSYGIYNREYYNWTDNPETIKRWRDGSTGVPLIDALMREMNCTGFMPNRGRMIVACYLAMDLKQDWRHGAYFFEQQLIDHDVHSNYGGWCFSAGIGPGRVLIFNTVKQSKDHDKNGEYIKKWIPELKNVPSDYIHEPWTMPKNLQQGCKTIIGQDYPLPIPCPKYTQAGYKKEKRSKSTKA